MSPRAACRLETLGYTQVFDYTAGLADWWANGLPTEGEDSDELRVKDALSVNVPTCLREATVGEAAEQMKLAGWKQCVVVSETNVVLGRLRLGQTETGLEASVELRMEAGPTTIRPDVLLADYVEHMRSRRVGSIIVTKTTGELMGVLLREEGEKQLAPRIEL